MENINKTKIALAAFFSIISSYLGVLAVPVYILVTANIVDYLTGITASYYRKENIKSNIGIRGIAKKVGMWVLVFIAWQFDMVLAVASQNIGVNLGLKYFVSISVTIWIICNEFISIIENIADIGTETPPFLLKLIKLLKGKTDKE